MPPPPSAHPFRTVDTTTISQAMFSFPMTQAQKKGANPLGLAPAKPKEKESAPPPKKWKSPSQMKGTGKLGRYIEGIGQFRGGMNKGGMVGRRGKDRK